MQDGGSGAPRAGNTAAQNKVPAKQNYSNQAFWGTS